MKKNENFDKSIIENEMILLKYQSLTENQVGLFLKKNKYILFFTQSY